ncbi:MAG: GNAT family N-acetyltransferase [Deinococcales bacterium]
MSGTVRFVPPHDAAWPEALACAPHDVYHLPAYTLLAQRLDAGRAGAFLYRDGNSAVLWPLIVRSVPAELDGSAGWLDATGVYGYGSPVVSEDVTPATLAEALDAIGHAAAEMGVVAIFSRLHPLLPFRPARWPAGCTAVDSGTTAAIDLRLDAQSRWAALSQNHRRGVRKLRASGFTVAWGDWARLEAFERMYLETMDRVGAPAYYRFGHDYFVQLAHDLEPFTRFGVVSDVAGRPAAAGLFFACQGFVQYHLGATFSAFLGQAPSKLLFWEASEFGAAHGDNVLHLGGGYGGGDDSLLRFKLGFATDRHLFRTLRFVTNDRAYRDLCRAAGRPDSDGGASAVGFFPKYRDASREGNAA